MEWHNESVHRENPGGKRNHQNQHVAAFYSAIGAKAYLVAEPTCTDTAERDVYRVG
jgi:hypothetical protein